MPYRNPFDKRKWEETHRHIERERFKLAAAWADSQIGLLDSLHPRPESRRELRRALIHQYLSDGYGSGVERPNSDPASL